MEEEKLCSAQPRQPSHHRPSYVDFETERAAAAGLCKDATLKGTELSQLPQLIMDFPLTSIQTTGVLMST
jgi:hypothetical protein